MKKLILILMLLAPVFMYACNKGNGNGNTDKPAQTETKKVIAEDQNDQKDKGDDKAAIHINEEQFKKKVMNYEKHDTWQFAGDKPCIVDFYADWCAPCRITSPILEDLAQEYKGKINVYKVDIEKNKKLASVFGVRSIPTFLYCPTDGKPRKAQGIGKSKEATKQMFKKNIETILLNNK
jgi:thioredoxin